MVAPFNVKAALQKRTTGSGRTPDAPQTPSFRPQVGLPDAANALAFDVAVTVDIDRDVHRLDRRLPGRRPSHRGQRRRRPRPREVPWTSTAIVAFQ